MSAGARLHRASTAPPVRMLHLGLGSFFRAHQAWYTDRSADAGEWGYAAFTGRRPDLAVALRAQDGLYTLISRAADGDRFSVVGSVARAHAAGEHETWLAEFARPDVALLTLTITEAGYRRDAQDRLDTSAPDVAADVAALRRDPRATVSTGPARIVAGLLARRQAGAGPITLVPCDNLPQNGPALAAVVLELAEAVDADLAAWCDEQVSTVTTMVDRITPATTDADRAAVAATGVADRSPVVTEPFSEWVLSGRFAAGRPAWDGAGARFVDDVTPYEDRKLWLLNGAHSLLAYAGSLRGWPTVADAIADPACRQWVEQWWGTCAPHLDLPGDAVAAYRAALLDRFANPRIEHLLRQIAADGSQKLPVRVLPVLGEERTAGRLPEGALRILAAWVLHLRGAGAPVSDVRAGELTALAGGPLGEAVPATLAALDTALADDAELVAAVERCATGLGAR